MIFAKPHWHLLDFIKVHANITAVSGKKPFGELEVHYRQGSEGRYTLTSTHIEIRDRRDGWCYHIDAQPLPDRPGCRVSGQLNDAQHIVRHRDHDGLEAMTLLAELRSAGLRAGSLKELAQEADLPELCKAFVEEPAAMPQAMKPRRARKPKAPKLEIVATA